MKNIKTSGALLFLAGSIILMGIITAEAFYPSGYTTANSEISDLGATVRPNSVTYQPSATIFNYTMMLAGLMVAMAALLQHKWYKNICLLFRFYYWGLVCLALDFFLATKIPIMECLRYSLLIWED
jgi:hypothetical membrane protein